MKLITCQPKAIADLLLAGLPAQAAPEFDMGDVADVRMHRAYTWMVQQMQRQLIVPAEHPDVSNFKFFSQCPPFPMWAWLLTPDVPVEDLLTPDKGDYIIEMEVPHSAFLASEYDLWHHVLNDWPVELYEDEAPDKEESWQRIFCLNLTTGRSTLDSPDRQYMLLDDPARIQACMWFIDPRWVTSIKESAGMNIQVDGTGD